MAAATTPPYYPNPFVSALLMTLVPYFGAYRPPGDENPLTDIVRTLSDYAARTRAEMLHAAQIIAFGFSALETLAEAKGNAELTPAQRLRFRACANALHRSSRQNAAALASRLACDIPSTAGLPLPDPVNDVTDAEAAEVMRQAQAKIDACRNRLGKAPAQSTAHPSSDRRLRGSVLAHIFNPAAVPERPAAPA